MVHGSSDEKAYGRLVVPLRSQQSQELPILLDLKREWRENKDMRM